MIANKRKKYVQPADVGAPFVPTPAEILDGCRRIQATWSRQEERSRRLYDVEANRLVLTRVVDLSLNSAVRSETDRNW
jgi:hypothetical protein